MSATPADFAAVVAARGERLRALMGHAPKDPDTCEAFLLCTNPATTTIPNAILGDVPACQRCADKMAAIRGDA